MKAPNLIHLRILCRISEIDYGSLSPLLIIDMIFLVISQAVATALSNGYLREPGTSLTWYRIKPTSFKIYSDTRKGKHPSLGYGFENRAPYHNTMQNLSYYGVQYIGQNMRPFVCSKWCISKSDICCLRNLKK